MRLKYNLLQFMRDKEVLFYALVFPLIMGVIFYFAVGFVDEHTGEIPIAIVDEGNQAPLNQAFLELASSLEQEGRLTISFVSYETAAGMLQAAQVSGVVILGDAIELMLLSSGVEQNILEGLVSEFTIRSATIANIAELRPQYLPQALAAIESFVSVNSSVRDIPVSAAANFFYLLLAMGSFTSSIRGLKMGFELQAHVSGTAARLSVAPTKKLVLIFENLVSSVTMQTMSTIVILLFYVFILGIDFGTRWGFLLLACMAGSFASVAFGLLFSVALPGSIDKKSGYLAIITYAFLFSGGIFGGVAVREIVRSAAPFIDRINIVTIISDTFLSLVLHEDLSRYIQQLGILIVCSIAGAIVLRSKSYANL